MSDALWILDERGQPKPEPDAIRWARWLESSGETRVVARTELPGGRVVSTVFLGIDHNWRFVGPKAERMPVLWETMCFRADGRAWGALLRWQSREDAEAGHRELVEELNRKAQQAQKRR